MPFICSACDWSCTDQRGLNIHRRRFCKKLNQYTANTLQVHKSNARAAKLRRLEDDNAIKIQRQALREELNVHEVCHPSPNSNRIAKMQHVRLITGT